MQDCCYLQIGGLTIRVLRQSTRYGCRLKLRRTGRDGNPLDDESTYLSDPTDAVAKRKLQALLEGHTIRV